MPLEFSSITLCGLILNGIGGTIRWLFGFLYRTISNKKKYSFTEYINAPKNKKDVYNTLGHEFNNKVIGAIFLASIGFCLSR